jgi:hypothetical protein
VNSFAYWDSKSSSLVFLDAPHWASIQMNLRVSFHWSGFARCSRRLQWMLMIVISPVPPSNHHLLPLPFDEMDTPSTT